MKIPGDNRYASLIDEVLAVCTQLQSLRDQLASLEDSYMTFALSFDKEKQAKAQIKKILRFVKALKKRHAKLVELVEQKVSLLRDLQHSPVSAAGYLKQEKTKKILDEVEEKLKLLAVA